MKKKLTNIEVILIIAICIKLFGLIYRIFLTRYLTIEGMRIMSLIFPTLSLALCLSSLSVSTVVNQNIAAKLNHSKTIVKSAFRITFISSSIISICLMLSFPIYRYIYQDSFIYYPLLICIPLIYLSNTSGILKGYLEANNHFKTTYFSNFYEQIAKFIFTFSMLFIFHKQSLNFKVFICFFAMMLSEVVSFIYLLVKVKKKRKFHYQSIHTNGYERAMLKQALPLTLEQLVVSITSYLEPLIFYYAIKQYGCTLYDATLYYTKVSSYAIPLLIFAHFGVLNIAKFVFPKITQAKDTDNLPTILSKAFFLCLFIAVINLVVCYFYAYDALKFMYGDTSAISITQQMALFYFFFYFDPLFIIILQAYKKEKKLLLSSIISSVILLLLVFILSALYGYSGLLTAIIIGHTIKFLLLFFFANQCVHFKFKIKNLVFIFATTIFFFLINYWFTNVWCLALSTLLLVLLALFLYYYFFGNKKVYHGDRMHK